MDKISDHILGLITAYTSGEITQKEFRVLQEWIRESPENRLAFIAHLHAYKKWRRTGFMQTLDKGKAWELITSKLKTPLQPVSKSKYIRFTTRYFKYAAAILVLLALGFFYQQGYFSPRSDDVLVPREEAVTLQLDNGKIEIIDTETSQNVTDARGNLVGKQNKNQITYTPNAITGSMAYNTLTVPYGKRFEVILSDGTSVRLNAGTSLKYPTHFQEGEHRQVFLNGEAFFEVAKDAERPFIVNADDLNVRVLGTRFNVAIYPEDEATDVVLVEGAVGLYTEDENFNPDKNTVLSPGHIAVFNRKEKTISTKEVVTRVYTSWTKGELVFRNMPLESILKKLERHYNITIINNNTELAQKEFNASFGREPIEKVLEYFKISYGITYKIEDNKVIIE
ncbi:DUF4974 domain-containing protein [Sinomicrobium kalidii]|uniref:FecR family protein n=1 Tax=Sinomicrobium kalidii TaxID=2900738 RepID=UPI001E373B09|nr:FecR family protein [Sinomicrobium kalidii]UGU15471.1 DUF4974 domain-containing protein [Sinomicrobium kalidii]